MSSPPLLVNVAVLRRRTGNRRHLRLEAPVADIAITTARVPADADVVVDVMLEAVPEGVTATGEVSAPFVGECRRCLELVSGTVRAEVKEVFHDRPLDEETYPINSEQVDLEPLARDALLLTLPLVPLCRDDCVGPEPEAFPVITPSDEDSISEAPLDPRWAALEGFRPRSPE